MLEHSLRHHPGQLDETKADDSQVAGQSARPPQVRLWEIAERVLVVPRLTAMLASHRDRGQRFQHRPLISRR